MLVFSAAANWQKRASGGGGSGGASGGCIVGHRSILWWPAALADEPSTRLVRKATNNDK